MCNDNRVKGKLYAVGLGPGDPGLLTVKAVEILKNADLLIAPRAGFKTDSIARDIVTRAIGEDLPFLEMIFPMSRDEDVLQKHWDDNALTVLGHLDEGKNVAFITLGDVNLYSTFSYLQRAIETKDPSYKPEIIPGISSIQLAASLFDKPLALGGESFGVFPLPEDLHALDRAFKMHNTVMIMKIGKRLNELRDYLKERGLLTSSSFVRRAGFPDQFISADPETMGDDESGYLSIMMVRTGETE